MTVMTTKMIAAQTRSSTIALLLDQEKAYDRVLPDYLTHIMRSFRIPAGIINSVRNLFFPPEYKSISTAHYFQ